MFIFRTLLEKLEGKKLIYKTRGNGQLQRRPSKHLGQIGRHICSRKLTPYGKKNLFTVIHVMVAPFVSHLVECWPSSDTVIANAHYVTYWPAQSELVWPRVFSPQAPHIKLVSKCCSLPPNLKTDYPPCFCCVSLAFLGGGWKFQVNHASQRQPPQTALLAPQNFSPECDS